MDQSTLNVVGLLLDRKENLPLDTVFGDNFTYPLLVVYGSESDVPRAKPLMDLLTEVSRLELAVSAHRNPEMIAYLAYEIPDNVVVLAIGGLSFQLPAVLRSWMNAFGRTNQIFGFPVGSSPHEIGAAVSAMTDLPSEMRESLKVCGNPDAAVFFSEMVREALTKVDPEKRTIKIGPPSKPPKVLTVHEGGEK